MGSDKRGNLLFVAITLMLVGEFLAVVAAPLSAWSIWIASVVFSGIMIRARNRRGGSGQR